MSNGTPYAPRGGGLVYLELLSDRFVRRVVLIPSVDNVLDGLYSFAYGLRYRRLDTLGYETRYETMDAGVVGECGNDATLRVPLACCLVEDGVCLYETEDHGEVAAKPNRHITHLLRQDASIGDGYA